MYKIRKSNERGYFDHGWLKSYHTFSFAEYHDSNHIRFGPLRVINEDYIEGGAGFPTHPHRDMEIITYPISGALEHKDSTGASGVILPYEVQKMSAGSGILHSEFNHKTDQTTHLLQIWIFPNKKNLTPSYEQKNFESKISSYRPTLIVSSNAQNDSLLIHQDVNLWAKKSKSNEVWNIELNDQRKYWLQLISGELQVQMSNNSASSTNLKSGDAIALDNETTLNINSLSESEILFFDMIDV